MIKLEKEYEKVATLSIKKGLITREEWENRFKNYRDEYGHSFLHYLTAVMNGCDAFITFNKIMLDNKEELEGRFKVKIRSPIEAYTEGLDKQQAGGTGKNGNRK